MSFFFNDTATTEIYTLSLHDALPICFQAGRNFSMLAVPARLSPRCMRSASTCSSEGLTSVLQGWLVIRGECEIGRAHVELQSRQYLVCRLLLEKKLQST